jgi:hypothetical protein
LGNVYVSPVCAVSTEATTGQAEDRTSGLDQNRFSRHEFSARDVFVMLVRLIAVLERIDHEQFNRGSYSERRRPLSAGL